MHLHITKYLAGQGIFINAFNISDVIIKQVSLHEYDLKDLTSIFISLYIIPDLKKYNGVC